MDNALDVDLVAREWLRALRGRRSQRALSKRLGYSSNIAYRWESGACWPAASRFFQVLGRLGIEVGAGLERFFHGAEQTRDIDPTATQGVSLLLQRMRHGTSVVELARRSGHNRFAVARWLAGNAQPRLPELLRMVAACTGRLLDFVAAFTPPERLPSLAQPWAELEAARALAFDLPLSHAVLRALELQDYAALPAHEPGWIAARLGIEPDQEVRALALLAGAGQIALRDGRYHVLAAPRVDLRADPERTKRLRAFWIETALDRLRADRPGVYGYNVFSIAERDLERLQELHREHHERVRALIAASSPEQRVVLLCTQLVPLDHG